MSSELATLRAELKIWEKQFKAENERAATPDDIRLIPGLGWCICSVASNVELILGLYTTFSTFS